MTVPNSLLVMTPMWGPFLVLVWYEKAHVAQRRFSPAVSTSCVLGYSTGLTHHRHLCPERHALSASCSKVQAWNTYEERKRFLKLGNLLFGE